MNDAPDNPSGSTVAPSSGPTVERSNGPTVERSNGSSVARSNGSTVAAAGGSSDGHGPDRASPGIDGVSGFMGMRWDDASTVRLTIRPELINAAGLLSGVVTYALVDYCMGSALWVQTSEEEHIATISISINYIQTATEGEIVCTTELDRRNRSNAVLRSEVRHEDGRLLVTAIGSYTIFPARKRPRPSLTQGRRQCPSWPAPLAPSPSQARIPAAERASRPT